MLTGGDLRDKVSLEELKRFLATPGEGDAWDFKLTLAFEQRKSSASGRVQLTTHARVELARDIFGLANTMGGGHLILGVRDKTYEIVGLDVTVPPIETEMIAKAIASFHKSIRLVAVEYPLTDPLWLGVRRIGLIYVAEYDGIAIPTLEGKYSDPHDPTREIIRFRENDIIVRRNAQTCTANEQDLARLRLRVEQLGATIDQDVQQLPATLPAREEIGVSFIGRKKELESLWVWFKDSHSRVWLLPGDGGKGKSALAYEFACQVQVVAPPGYYTVVWLSAKQHAFVEGKTRPTATPDFWDLPSLIDAIGRAYGYVYATGTPIEERRAHVMELLAELPALLVADDIDSVALEHQDTFTFLMGLMGTMSKVLFTSRRVLFGLNAASTPVTGLNEEDGPVFITSRLRLLHLDQALFNSRVRQRILKVTEGNPLFIEDLLRLSASCRSVDNAIAQWEKGDGDAAREYALRRELETLSPQATEILISCCLPDDPVSFAEIQNMTGFTERRIGESLAELQHLFLVSSPRLIEDVQRFDVLVNTRTLVRTVFAKSDQYRRLCETYDHIQGQQDIRARRDIGAYIKQASAQQALGQHNEAERTIETALERYPNHPDLIAQLGLIYSRWSPAARLVETRAQFKRAAQLKCKREVVYDLWARLEIGSGEFTEAARVAKVGRDLLGDTMALLYREGYARSRLGQELRRSLHPGRAQQELREADGLLRRALKDPEALAGPSERQLNSRTFMALVLNYEALGDTPEMYRLLDRWQREHPDYPPPRQLVGRLRTTYEHPPRES